MQFSDWITQKYIEWRGPAVGHDRSITQFASWIGVSQPLMNDWMKKGGKIPRSQQTINKLVAKFGAEVYDVLGLDRPDQDPFSVLPPAIRERLRAAMAEMQTEYESRGIDPDSPEGSELSRSILEKHGFTVKTIS